MKQTVRALTNVFVIDRELRESERLSPDKLVALDELRAVLRNSISGFLLVRYDRLMRAGRQRPVAAVEEGHCGGCHLRLPPQLVYRIRMANSLLPCPHCGRLIYPVAVMPDEDSGEMPTHVRPGMTNGKKGLPGRASKSGRRNVRGRSRSEVGRSRGRPEQPPGVPASRPPFLPQPAGKVRNPGVTAPPAKRTRVRKRRTSSSS